MHATTSDGRCSHQAASAAAVASESVQDLELFGEPPPIGTVHPCEWREETDEATGRHLRRLTSAPANSYPLYYFVPSITDDGRYFVFHSERSGWVQLYRLDMTTGEITQLTAGTTRRSGWCMWCEWLLRGIYNHLSALDPARGEVWYFQDEELRIADVAAVRHRLVARLEGRMPIGQSSVSPDGSMFAFIDADRQTMTRALEDRQAMWFMKHPFDRELWRQRAPSAVKVAGRDGTVRTVLELPYNVHHVIWIDDSTLLLNHPLGTVGMLAVDLHSGYQRILRPANNNGNAHHQVVTKGGVFYETSTKPFGHVSYYGRYEPASDTWREKRLPDDLGGNHVGKDPLGQIHFIEHNFHGLALLRGFEGDGPLEMQSLRRFPEPPGGVGQRYHAHPFLGPDRRWLYYTETVNGFSQISALDISDITGAQA
jgi:hypothetical protein